MAAAGRVPPQANPAAQAITASGSGNPASLASVDDISLAGNIQLRTPSLKISSLNFKRKTAGNNEVRVSFPGLSLAGVGGEESVDSAHFKVSRSNTRTAGQESLEAEAQDSASELSGGQSVPHCLEDTSNIAVINKGSRPK